MKQEFIQYQPALELKELRFDEPCLGYYLCRNSAFGIDDLLITTEWIDLLPYDSSSCKAPTFSQAFRWFREKYGLYHVINMFGDWDNPQYGYIISGKTMDNPAHMWYYENVDSYEEAELACLIKLIEIVKTK
jgi:hypothetical protein